MNYEFEITETFGSRYQWGVKVDGDVVALSGSLHATKAEAKIEAFKATHALRNADLPSDLDPYDGTEG